MQATPIRVIRGDAPANIYSYDTTVAYTTALLQRSNTITRPAAETELGSYQTRDLLASHAARIEHASSSGALNPLASGVARSLTGFLGGSNSVSLAVSGSGVSLQPRAAPVLGFLRPESSDTYLTARARDLRNAVLTADLQSEVEAWSSRRAATAEAVEVRIQTRRKAQSALLHTKAQYGGLLRDRLSRPFVAPVTGLGATAPAPGQSALPGTGADSDSEDEVTRGRAAADGHDPTQAVYPHPHVVKMTPRLPGPLVLPRTAPDGSRPAAATAARKPLRPATADWWRTEGRKVARDAAAAVTTSVTAAEAAATEAVAAAAAAPPGPASASLAAAALTAVLKRPVSAATSLSQLPPPSATAKKGPSGAALVPESTIDPPAPVILVAGPLASKLQQDAEAAATDAAAAWERRYGLPRPAQRNRSRPGTASRSRPLSAVPTPAVAAGSGSAAGSRPTSAAPTRPTSATLAGMSAAEIREWQIATARTALISRFQGALVPGHFPAASASIAARPVSAGAAGIRGVGENPLKREERIREMILKAQGGGKAKAKAGKKK